MRQPNYSDCLDGHGDVEMVSDCYIYLFVCHSLVHLCVCMTVYFHHYFMLMGVIDICTS